MEEAEVLETQQNLIETHEVPTSDTECLIAEEPVENLVEIIDLTDQAIQGQRVSERRQSIVIDHQEEVRVCDLDHPSDTNSNDRLIKKQVTERTVSIQPQSCIIIITRQLFNTCNSFQELKPSLLDQPFFQRLSSLSIKVSSSQIPSCLLNITLKELYFLFQEKLMVCFGGLVAVFVFAASVFL